MGSAELMDALRRDGAAGALQIVETARRKADRERAEADASWELRRSEAFVAAEAEVRERTAADLMEARRFARRRVLEARHRAIEQVLGAVRGRLTRALTSERHLERSRRELDELLDYLPAGEPTVRCPRALASTEHRIEIDEALDGFVISSQDGSVTIDATLSRRLDRSRPQLSIRILQMIDGEIP
jgi:vacuolar-type H+-ATPase subunit E/Vma4